MRLGRRLRGVAFFAAALLVFGAPSVPGVAVDWAPSIGVAWATPCDGPAGPEESTALDGDANDRATTTNPNRFGYGSGTS